MRLQHIVVAADETEVSRNAVRTALAWAHRASARLTVLSVSNRKAVPAGEGQPSAVTTIERWLTPEIAESDAAAPRIAEASGVPSIEIARFAEESAADLLVLGRKPRSAVARRLLGDTADAVARRSHVPCLFVPGADDVPDRLLVALDGTERGFTVFKGACRLAEALAVELDLVTVERALSDEPVHLAQEVRNGRSENLARAVCACAHTLQVRRGDVVTEILREIDARRARVLVVGYHRGGPPGFVEAGSVARQLSHNAPCAVLTIPL